MFILEVFWAAWWAPLLPQETPRASSPNLSQPVCIVPRRKCSITRSSYAGCKHHRTTTSIHEKQEKNARVYRSMIPLFLIYIQTSSIIFSAPINFFLFHNPIVLWSHPFQPCSTISLEERLLIHSKKVIYFLWEQTGLDLRYIAEYAYFGIWFHPCLARQHREAALKSIPQPKSFFLIEPIRGFTLIFGFISRTNTILPLYYQK